MSAVQLAMVTGSFVRECKTVDWPPHPILVDKYGASNYITGSSFPWVVDGHPVIGVLGFVLFGALIRTDTLLNPLFKLTFVTDNLARHV